MLKKQVADLADAALADEAKESVENAAVHVQDAEGIDASIKASTIPEHAQISGADLAARVPEVSDCPVDTEPAVEAVKEHTILEGEGSMPVHVECKTGYRYWEDP